MNAFSGPCYVKSFTLVQPNWKIFYFGDVVSNVLCELGRKFDLFHAVAAAFSFLLQSNAFKASSFLDNRQFILVRWIAYTPSDKFRNGVASSPLGAV